MINLLRNYLDSTNLLFDRIKDIHSEKGLEEICRRYLRYKGKLKRLSPDTGYI